MRFVRSILVLTLTTAAFGQLNRGTLTGVVRDPSGAAIPNAGIVATHSATNISVRANSTAAGDYTVPNLDIGEYRVTSEAKGFRRAVESTLSITPGSTVRLDFAMEIGAASESVEVSAKAVMLQTDSTQNSTNLNSRLVDDIPLVVNGGVRNIMNMAMVAPETKTANGFRIGGGQGAGWDALMDGASLTSGSSAYQTARVPIASVPVDAVSEFSVETSGSKAENGRAMGVLNFVTKSGTNEFHGSVFEFLRNNAMDARGFFAASTPVLKQHDFGATVGGPLRIPKVYNGKNRTFFFASYEGFRNRSGGGPQFLSVPLNAMYEGDFTGWIRNGKLAQLYDPATTRLAPSGSGYVRDAFAGNIIPKSRFSEVTSNVINLRDPKAMTPNVAGAVASNLFITSGARVAPSDKGSIRIDHQLTSKDRISFLYFRGALLDTFFGTPAGIPQPYNGSATTETNNASGRWSWDRVVSASVVNSFRFTYQRERGDGAAINSQSDADKWNAKIGIKNTPGPDHAFPGLAFTGLSGWGGNNWGGDRGRTINLADDVTFTKGRHTFKTGFFFARDTWIGVGQHRPNGDFSFSYLATAIPNDQTQATGSAFASFLLGYPDRAGLETPRAVLQRWPYLGGYFQDDWRVNNKLTLNLGLRYEYTMEVQGGAILGLRDWHDLSGGTEGGFSNFNPDVVNPGAGGLKGALQWSGNGTGACNCSLFNTYGKAWGPRVGAAYQFRPGAVLRISAGRSFGPVKSSGGSTHFEGLILNTNWSSSDFDVLDFPTLLDKGLPAWTPPPFRDPAFSNNVASTYYWQRSDAGRPPVLDSWNVNIQQQMKGNVVLSAAYSGTKGTHLDSAIVNTNQIDPKYIKQYGLTLLRSNITSAAARAANIPIPYAGFNSTVQRALSPFPQYQEIATNGGQPASIGERAGNSTYHAFILKADKRFSNGLTFLSSYVFSKILSDSDTNQITGRIVVDNYNRRLEKSLSGDDQTHVVRFAYSYELPLGAGRRFNLGKATNFAVGGWSISGSQNYESGTPLSVSSGVSPLGTGSRPWITSYDNWRAGASGGKFDPNADIWWDRNAFQQGLTADQINTTFGNSTRTNPKARNNWVLNESIAIHKRFLITERRYFTLRGEAFNIANRTRWGNPDSGLTSATFGQVRSQANTPRQMQVSLRFQF
ncbi:MAG: hypothetical protein JWN34_1290 [Bryobacterales bacterium]|nr:hypothetical protein [Bryobacterales bacterium]